MGLVEADAPSSEGAFLGGKEVLGTHDDADATLVPIHLLGTDPETFVALVTHFAQFQ